MDPSTPRARRAKGPASDDGHRNQDVNSIQRAVDHLYVRIDAALHDPAVDIRTFMGVVQEYAQSLMKLKVARDQRSRMSR